jgi:hypothetical protein
MFFTNFVGVLGGFSNLITRLTFKLKIRNFLTRHDLLTDIIDKTYDV